MGRSPENLVSRAPNEFWKYLNSLSQKGSKASSQIPLQEFHQYFESQNTIPAQHYFDKDFMHKIEKSVKNFEYKEASNSDDIIVSDVLDSPITRAEITRALKNLKTHKAPGPDGIPAEFLRQGEMEIGNTMYPIFNAILEEGEYPRKWAEGLINPTYKKGDPQDPDNYRKITILNSSSKVFESIINNRLTFKNDMMAHSDPYQAGFKKESRTNDNIFTLYSAIQIQKSIKKPLYTCFVDFTKAFDYVNRSALYHKLIESKVKSKLLRVLISMFNKAQSAVRWDGVVGDNTTSKSGVLQGGIVSPNLFNHYLYDIGNYLEKKDGILVGPNPLNYLLYADDLILMSTTASGLQNHINNLYKFCAAWHLIVSLPKTKVLTYNDSHKAEKYIFNFGKETIDIVTVQISGHNIYIKLQKCFRTDSHREATESNSGHVPNVQ